MSVLSLPTPDLPGVAPAFAPGSRRLAAPGRPIDRATLAHHVAVVRLNPRTLALVTGNAPGDLPADVLLVRWVAARLRALSGGLVAGEASAPAYRREAAGLVALGVAPAPAGEEILVGLAAAGRRLAAGRVLPEAAVAAFQSSLAGLAAVDAPAAVRRALEDAAKGGFPAHLVSLAELLGDPDVEDGAIRDAAGRLAPGGARPGADTLAGVVALVRDVALGPP